MNTTRTSRRRRGGVASLAALTSSALLAGVTVAAPTQAQEGAPDDGSGRAAVEQQLRDELADDGTTDFWVYLRDEADLAPASAIADRGEQGVFVYERLTTAAEASQAGLRAILDAEGVDYESFWIANTVRVTGDEELLERIAGLPEVEQITADRVYEIPEPIPADEEPTVDNVEWGIDQVNAPQVWDTFGATGEGIVVGVIDTGALYTHEALVNQYRGNLGDGGFDHNYSWHDPSEVCDSPSLEPCDNLGHGTHVTGTIVGGDGGDNRIGMAPGARWIAAKGCETTTSCSQAALLSSGQFMLAPTDLNDRNPRPDLRPHIVNNSWGGGATTDPWYEPTVTAWVEAGIFPQFAGGNWNNPGTAPCATASNPGNLADSYAAGAFDVAGEIASFSNRGPSAWGSDVVKPNIAAPGVAVRSAWNDGGYDARSGTSMASPHVAGSVALLWSAAPAIERDVAATRELLDQTAIDVEDLTCGGTAENNNVWGQGQLDVFGAVEASPQGPIGTLAGTVTDGATPVSGAAVTITGDLDREVITDPDGAYSTRLLAGAYTVTVEAFGYQPASDGATVAADATTTLDFELAEVAQVTVSGRVTDGSGHGWPMYASVAASGTPVRTFTDPVTGDYTLRIPADDTYELVFDSEYPGYASATATVDASTDTSLDLALEMERCNAAPGYEYGADIAVLESASGDMVEQLDARGIPATQLSWEDDPSPYDVVIVNVATGPITTQPYLDFLDAADAAGVGMLFLDSWVNQTGIWQLRARTGIPSQRTNGFGFNIPYLYYEVLDQHPVLDGFEVGQEIVFDETSQRKEHAWFDGYEGEGRQVIGLAGRGDTGALGPGIGVQERANNRHVLLSMHASRPGNGMERWTDDAERIYFNALSWLAPDATFDCLQVDGGLVLGHVTDLNTDTAVNGATVTSVADPEQTATSAASLDDVDLAGGFYWLFSATGGRQFTAAADRYVEVTDTVEVTGSAVTRADFALPAGRLSLDASELDAGLQLGQSTERTLTITNTGTGTARLSLDELRESVEILGGDPDRGNADGGDAGGEVVYVEGDFTFAAPSSSSAHTAPEDAPVETGPAEPRPAADPWTDLPNYPRSIMDNAAAVVDGTLYSFAGFDGLSARSESYAFNPLAGQWTTVASLPEPRIKPEAVEIDGLIYVVGGWAGGEFDPTATTFIYDPASNSWSRGADMPAGRAAPGATALDGQLYVVGGCTTSSCTPMANEVFRYDPSVDEWETLAGYPAGASWLGCAGLDGNVFCAGGTNGLNALSATWAYDPDADAWSERASLPYPNWAMAYAAANGQLAVSGGIISGSLATNRSAAYDPGDDRWSTIAPANVPVYRGAGACGFYRVGGSLFDFTPLAHAEQHPGFSDCVLDVDLPWLAADPSTATLAPGESATVTVSIDSGQVDQPGTYTAGIEVGHDTPYFVTPVGVTMTVDPPNNWGKISGTVVGLGCHGDEVPQPGALVRIDGRHDQVTLWTDEQGRYSYWLAGDNGPLELLVTAGGYLPESQRVTLRPMQETVRDVTLQAICAAGVDQEAR